MDETQRRKISAKEFLEKNRRVGFIVATIFVSLFIIYFAFVYFYTRNQNLESQNATTTDIIDQFTGSLLPVFNEGTRTDSQADSDFLTNFAKPGQTVLNTITGGNGDRIENDASKLVQIESKPILGYTVFDKPISIKSYIKNKPKICAEKMEVVLKKEAESTAVKVFQATLKSMQDYEDTPETGILDEKTREKIYVFQKRYADILYKKKEDKTPTRVIDKETAHFLNLLCDLEKENKDDYVQVPTLRYVLKETREIFDYNTDSKDKIQIDAKLATGTEEIIMSENGQYVVFRKNLEGTLISDFYNIRIKSITHLENNITSAAFNSKGTLIYGISTQTGMTIKAYDALGNRVRRIAQIPLNDWNLTFTSDTSIGISSKASAFADGIYMVLDTLTGKLRQQAGPLPGMSVQTTNYADLTILSMGSEGETKTLLLNNQTRNIGDFGIKTFAEKCSHTIFLEGIFCGVPRVLPSNFTYPDDWYKGRMTTADNIVFKTISGTTSKIISFLEERPISVVNLNVNKNGIFFMDDNTFALYSIEI